MLWDIITYPWLRYLILLPPPQVMLPNMPLHVYNIHMSLPLNFIVLIFAAYVALSPQYPLYGTQYSAHSRTTVIPKFKLQLSLHNPLKPGVKSRMKM